MTPVEKLVQALPWPLAQDLLRLMRVDRPVGTWLLLWPSLWSLLAAGQGGIPWDLLVVFIVGAFVMRSAGCVANDMADRNIDPHVERTRLRPLAAGRVPLWMAGVLLFGLLLLALGLALQLNRRALELCVVGAFLAVSYPFTKRFIQFPQFYMGVAFGWGVVIAWAAVTGSVGLPAWFLFAATLAWAAGYDTIYAMMDREDDRRIGVNSTAILFGRWDRVAVGMLYGLSLLLLVQAGRLLGLGWGYYAALGAVLGQMAWQLWRIRRREQDRPALLAAFLSNTWVGGMVGLGVLAGYWV